MIKYASEAILADHMITTYYESNQFTNDPLTEAFSFVCKPIPEQHSRLLNASFDFFIAEVRGSIESSFLIDVFQHPSPLVMKPSRTAPY